MVNGTRLGPYQIFAAIGAGGMGAVYITTSSLPNSEGLRMLAVCSLINPSLGRASQPTRKYFTNTGNFEEATREYQRLFGYL